MIYYFQIRRKKMEEGKVFIFSKREIVEYFRKKYKAYINPKVADNAEPNSLGVLPNRNNCDIPYAYNEGYRGKGYGITRNMVNSSYEYYYPYLPEYVHDNGTFTLYERISTDAGMRPACMPIYDKKSDLLKTLHYESMTSLVFLTSNERGNVTNPTDVYVTTEAPIVEDNGIKYIWLNQEDCEKSRSKVMIICTVEYVAAAEIGKSPTEQPSRFAVMTAPTKWAEKHMSESLKNSLVKVDISNDITVPIFENTQDNSNDEYNLQ